MSGQTAACRVFDHVWNVVVDHRHEPVAVTCEWCDERREVAASSDDTPEPKIAPVSHHASNVVLVGEDGHRFVNGEGCCFVCGDQAEDHEPVSADASSPTPDR